MKKSILHVSFMIGLTTLFTACSSGKHSHHSANNGQEKPPISQNNQEKPHTHQMALNEKTFSSDWSGYSCGVNQFCTSTTTKPNQISLPSETLTLTAGDNTNAEKHYKFNLLTENNTGVIYYGYKQATGTEKENKQIELSYAINKDFISKTKIAPSNNTKYYGKEGFIYTSTSNKPFEAKYADISILYKDNIVTGEITEPNNKNNKLFTLKGTDSNDYISVFPIEKSSQISIREKTNFSIRFVNSEEGKNDNKYIVGAGLGDTWSGVFVAEKQNETPTTTTKP